MSNYEYYKLIRNTVKLVEVDLIQLTSIKNLSGIEKFEGSGDSEDNENEDGGFQLNLKRRVKVLNKETAELFLETTVEIPNIFAIGIEYRGKCINLKSDTLSEDEFKKYAYDQVVPLLVPYARELITNTMARMDLPIFTLPTMDILMSLEANKETSNNQE